MKTLTRICALPVLVLLLLSGCTALLTQDQQRQLKYALAECIIARREGSSGQATGRKPTATGTSRGEMDGRGTASRPTAHQQGQRNARAANFQQRGVHATNPQQRSVHATSRQTVRHVAGNSAYRGADGEAPSEAEAVAARRDARWKQDLRRGLSAYRSFDYAECVDALTRVIDHPAAGGARAQAYVYRGAARFLLGDDAGAARDFRSGARLGGRIDPDVFPPGVVQQFRDCQGEGG